MEENLGAVNVELTAEDLRRIKDAASHIVAHVERYTEAGEKHTDR